MGQIRSPVAWGPHGTPVPAYAHPENLTAQVVEVLPPTEET